MSEYRNRLTEEIISRSQSKIWDIAKLEWSLYDIYEAEEPETCLCGHFPIIEICTVRNKLNGKIAKVGNICVKKFLELPSDLIFQAVKRVRKDIQRSLNAEAIQYAYDKDLINEWEYDFLKNTMRKRNLSQDQFRCRVKLNNKMLAHMKRSSGGG